MAAASPSSEAALPPRAGSQVYIYDLETKELRVEDRSRHFPDGFKYDAKIPENTLDPLDYFALTRIPERPELGYHLVAIKSISKRALFLYAGKTPTSGPAERRPRPYRFGAKVDGRFFSIDAECEGNLSRMMAHLPSREEFLDAYILKQGGQEPIYANFESEVRGAQFFLKATTNIHASLKRPVMVGYSYGPLYFAGFKITPLLFTNEGSLLPVYDYCYLHQDINFYSFMRRGIDLNLGGEKILYYRDMPGRVGISHPGFACDFTKEGTVWVCFPKKEARFNLKKEGIPSLDSIPLLMGGTLGQPEFKKRIRELSDQLEGLLLRGSKLLPTLFSSIFSVCRRLGEESFSQQQIEKSIKDFIWLLLAGIAVNLRYRAAECSPLRTHAREFLSMFDKINFSAIVSFVVKALEAPVPTSSGDPGKAAEGGGGGGGGAPEEAAEVSGGGGGGGSTHHEAIRAFSTKKQQSKSEKTSDPSKDQGFEFSA